MLRLLTYLASVLKLIVIGRWTPPGHVLDVSSDAFMELVNVVKELESRVREVEKLTEATRKKVYRDEVRAKTDEEIQRLVQAPQNQAPVESLAQSLAQKLANLGPGDTLPEDIEF